MNDEIKTLMSEHSLLSSRPVPSARIVEARGVVVRVVGASLRIGEMVRLMRPDRAEPQIGEVVGFSQEGALVVPLDGLAGLSDITQVEGCGLSWGRLDALDMLGRVVDGLGRPLDGRVAPKAVSAQHSMNILSHINPLDRPVISTPFPTGVRVIDGLLSCGVGQRVGIFAAAGGGKSTLMGMIANGASVDAIVVALIGERGREVGEFIHDHLGARRASSIVIASTSERPAAERIKAAELACRVASDLRAEGKHVLLLFDSLTRYARALREVGLAVGEPPVRRGYPPRVFAELPRLIETAGLTRQGAVTAFFTVLAEDEEMSDPVAEEARSLLDGHIQLSGRLGGAGHYPAIDVLKSKSRVMTRVTSRAHRDDAGRVRGWMSRYQEVELLLQIGEYRRGNDSASDLAIDRHEMIERFLRQRHDEYSDWEATIGSLSALCHGSHE
ncbi:FliI/YscN family ATPase [Paraburkholderia phytofirmans]|uniref:ATPase, FliI/YscN family n=1 Tax=Paraburkholderia phytofirmans (strain DSM 17436 / LMG 22146 / PsJN) TaxID=398527 RepID=B2TCZ2_PARPJ|nr:FliI/YscN family ATPase [Paraburkholderia phytofirmans]ACD19566.1 ATPase, FliI/YscN family [Paraburkholderia phytofirmans PsJN]